MERTYRQLVDRCKELKLNPCNGSRDVIKAKVEAEEARMEATIKKKAPTPKKERSVALKPKVEAVAERFAPEIPQEIITEEIFDLLDTSSLLALCTTNRAMKAVCEDQEVLRRLLRRSGHQEIQRLVKGWVDQGVMMETLMTLIRNNVESFDQLTLWYVYLYLLEETSETVKRQESSSNAETLSRYNDWRRMLKGLINENLVSLPSFNLYDAIVEATRAIKNNNNIDLRASRLFSYYVDKRQDEGILWEYIENRLVSLLTDAEIVRFSTFTKEGKRSLATLLPNNVAIFMNALFRGLLRLNRLTPYANFIATAKEIGRLNYSSSFSRFVTQAIRYVAEEAQIEQLRSYAPEANIVIDPERVTTIHMLNTKLEKVKATEEETEYWNLQTVFEFGSLEIYLELEMVIAAIRRILPLNDKRRNQLRKLLDYCRERGYDIWAIRALRELER